MQLPSDIIKCPGCGALFRKSWGNQELCASCQPLTINPVVEAILAKMPTRF